MPLGHRRVLDKHRLPIIVVVMPAALDLSTVSVRPIHASELERWQRLMEEEHYLQSNRMVGEQIRYVALDGDGRWVNGVALRKFTWRCPWRRGASESGRSSVPACAFA